MEVANNIKKKTILNVSIERIMVYSLIIILAFSTQSVLLGGALGVSISTATRIAHTAYRAYRAGKNIRTAVSSILGPGALAWIAVDFIIGYGVGRLLKSSRLISL